MLTEETLEDLKQRHKVWMEEGIVTRIEFLTAVAYHWKDIVDTLEKGMAALDTLHKIEDEEGKVCPDYETCRHPACASSYNSWMLANEALAGIPVA